jgi:periplasmic protein TonB
MKKKVFVSSFLILSFSLFAQETKEFMLNGYFKKEVNQKFISYIRKAQQQDTLWAYSDYSKTGKLIQTGYYTDTNFTKAVGHNVFYLYDNKLYEGNYLNGKPAGYWYFYDASGRVTDSLYYTFRDTTKKPSVFKDALATEKSKALKNEHLKKDTSAPALKTETPPGFPGGLVEWRKHLIKNLFVPEMVIESSPYSKGTVYVQFVVCNDGEVCSVEALNSVHPLVDLIAVKAIRKGPRWEPAVQNGRNVKAYQQQPITFILEEQ